MGADGRRLMPEPMVTFDCGAKRSERKPMYHKIPGCALRRLAERYSLGSKYDDPEETKRISGAQNWQKGDAEFFTEAFEHLIEHLYRFADGDRSVILHQVTNGLAVRMAVLYLCLGAQRRHRDKAGEGRN